MRRTRKVKTPRQKLAAECMKLWKEAVKLRDFYICRLCGKPGNHPHHHFTDKAHPLTRYVLLNGVTLCPSCHYKVHRRGQFEKVRAAIVAEIGSDSFDSLYQLAYCQNTTEIQDLEHTKAYLTTERDKFKMRYLNDHQLMRGDFYGGKL